MDRKQIDIDKIDIESFVVMLGEQIENEDWVESGMADFMAQLPYKGFNPHTVAKTAIKTFGQTGARQLSVIGATRGNNIEKFNDLQAKCDGEVQGVQTLQSLVDDGHLKPRGIMSQQPANRDPNVMTSTRLSQAMPQCVTLTLLEAEEE
ncbi:hypothetical protein G6F57_002755 [Rhizopus arrhizus]|nr:hypothetical protein G6F24_013887 [Rhizopus arrhizus]KAG1244144.1 hypothetical protein G6F68_015565 [Rhizopus microsporus]KAG1392599.1 hypothetical protein G6F58_012485 [Rhizopus delemar]KAG0773162.1 hypothetical protein G6F22_015113 [Rhizopus arrhizus]KAG0796302.1 hypothetical protein G6F21_001428 [Rhizopus arrhizus]